MKQYTANYAYTNPNFVIQNMVGSPIKNELLPVLCVLKNILQRGFPTTMSKFLQGELGAIQKLDNFNDRFLFSYTDTPKWIKTIKGDTNNDYNPALYFYEKIVSNEFQEYCFIQSLIIPEIEINTLVGEENENFVHQRVDFYLPQAKLVIEIDGGQHKVDVNRVSDSQRDSYLNSKGITTVRISTQELRTGTYSIKVNQIIEHLRRFEKLLDYYRRAFNKIEAQQITGEEKKTKLLPTAIIRFQILLIELLTYNYLTFREKWKFNLLVSEDIEDFAELAIRDIHIWLAKLWRLKNKTKLQIPSYSVRTVHKKEDFKPTTKTINIDFSLFKRYTDENEVNSDILFVRTDYFDTVKERNYFRVSTTEPINYQITENDKDILEFLLDNIFDKPSFREGQFPIISNVLNRNDTIGLLPTGGGKSLCYQLPCLLQPSINFVVCPIKSLMYDQDENLKRTLVTNIAFITSDLDGDERRQIETDFEKGRYLFVFISPEKLQIPAFRNKMQAILANFSMAYAVIDEVHCLSEWGHDFRTSYLNLAKTIDKLSPKDDNGEGVIKFIGLTATASVNVLKDIKVEFSRQKNSLNDENIKSMLDYSRKELEFIVKNDSGKKLPVFKEILTDLVDREGLTESEEKAAIIFTPNVNGALGCYPVSNIVEGMYPNKVAWFAGKVPEIKQNDQAGRSTGIKLPLMSSTDFKVHKEGVQSGFKKNKYSLLVATKAFGMGIDKQNIHYTIHYGLPSSVESLYQEAGRAGRWDKNKKEYKNIKAKCYVLYSPETINEDEIQRLFNKDTSFSEMKAISNLAGRGGKDLLTQIHLFINGQHDIEDDFTVVKSVIEYYFEPNTNKNIFWKDAYQKIGVNKDVLQKTIYRLSLLGIVSDWSTNFIDHFEVDFCTLDEESILSNVSQYVNKYEPDRDVRLAIYKVDKSLLIDKAIWYLLSWIFNNISYNRKQSLKTLLDWCRGYKDSDSFKNRIIVFLNLLKQLLFCSILQKTLWIILNGLKH